MDNTGTESESAPPRLPGLVRPDVCPVCDYDLTRVEDVICPECGCDAAYQYARRGPRKRVRVIVVCLALSLACWIWATIDVAILQPRALGRIENEAELLVIPASIAIALVAAIFWREAIRHTTKTTHETLQALALTQLVPHMWFFAGTIWEFISMNL